MKLRPLIFSESQLLDIYVVLLINYFIQIRKNKLFLDYVLKKRTINCVILT